MKENGLKMLCTSILPLSQVHSLNPDCQVVQMHFVFFFFLVLPCVAGFCHNLEDLFFLSFFFPSSKYLKHLLFKNSPL